MDQVKITDELVQELIEEVNIPFKKNHFIVAGGAPRDLTLGVTPKDIDLFLHCNTAYEFDKLKPNLELFIGRGTKVEEKKKYYGPRQTHGVWNYNFKGTELQIILFNSRAQSEEEFAKDVMEHFDFGICKIYYDRTGEVQMTDDFLDDQFNKKLTLVKFGTPAQLRKAISEHLPRLEAKYPTYQFTYKDHKEEDNRQRNEQAMNVKKWIVPGRVCNYDYQRMVDDYHRARIY